MGINDLLKLYKPIIQNLNISELKGKCAGIDMMVWLYRGVYAAINNSSAEDFSKSDLYLNFPLKMLLLLKEKGINCIAVFDGNNNEAKLSELKNRVEQKEINRQLALSLAKEGKEEESKKVMKRTLKIKRRMTNTLITLLKQLDIPIIVAPYEADSQLAYLYKNKFIDFAISEDSDLIPYGIEKIAFKLDSMGNMSYLDISQAKNNRDSIDDQGCHLLLSMSHYNLVSFCVMLGCDYLSSIKGFGSKSGVRLFKSVKDINQAVVRMKTSGKYHFDKDYLEKAKKAICVFYMQTVYDPKQNKLLSLNDLNYYGDTDTIDDLIIKSELSDVYLKDKNYYGPFFDDFEDYCKGNLDIKTKSKEKKIESNEIIDKYYRRFSNVLKFDSDVQLIPFEKKVDYITLGCVSSQKDNIEASIDIDKEIEYLKNEINKTTYSKVNDSDNNNIIPNVFLNHKRKAIEPIATKPEIEEEALLLSLAQIIQNEENNNQRQKDIPVSIFPDQNQNVLRINQTNMYSNNKWNISNNAEANQSKSASIIDDIRINN